MVAEYLAGMRVALDAYDPGANNLQAVAERLREWAGADGLRGRIAMNIEVLLREVAAGEL